MVFAGEQRLSEISGAILRPCAAAPPLSQTRWFLRGRYRKKVA